MKKENEDKEDGIIFEGKRGMEKRKKVKWRRENERDKHEQRLMMKKEKGDGKDESIFESNRGTEGEEEN